MSARARFLAITAMAAVAAGASGAGAAPLGDPTRPPPGLAAPAATGSVAPAARPSPSASAVAAPAPAAPPRLQSLHRPADDRAASALIDGQIRRIGDRLGDATLEEIRADGVVLRRDRGERIRLDLFPAAARTPASPPSKDTRP